MATDPSGLMHLVGTTNLFLEILAENGTAWRVSMRGCKRSVRNGTLTFTDLPTITSDESTTIIACRIVCKNKGPGYVKLFECNLTVDRKVTPGDYFKMEELSVSTR